MSDRNDTVHFYGWVEKEFEKSLTVETADGMFIIPTSQLRPGTAASAVGEEGNIAIPRWLAEDRGIEYDEDPT